jgi:hypothetical protein
MKLLVFYLSGLDRRRINAEATPFLHAALGRHPHTTMRNLPSNELLPTMLTGCYPKDHGVWGVRLQPGLLRGDHAPKRCWVDALPDVLTTTAQSVWHQITHKKDLSAVPPFRRRQYQITRTKYWRRKWPEKTLPTIGGLESLMGVVGADRARYFFSDDTHPHRTLLPGLATGQYDLEFVELYSLDRMQQWHGPEHPRVGDYYRYTDEQCAALDRKCREHGMRLMVVSDHGHEPVVGHVDVRQALRDTGIPPAEYNFFLELTILRMWFYTDRAERAITEAIGKLPHVTLHDHDSLREMKLDLDESYGHRFALIEPGQIFFPHDFYQPAANLWLGLIDAKQRPRFKSAKQRHNHGYQAHHPCEEGWMMLCDDASRRGGEGEAELIDLAPTVLSLMGESVPEHMRGRVVFEAGAPQSEAA